MEYFANRQIHSFLSVLVLHFHLLLVSVQICLFFVCFFWYSQHVVQNLSHICLKKKSCGFMEMSAVIVASPKSQVLSSSSQQPESAGGVGGFGWFSAVREWVRLASWCWFDTVVCGNPVGTRTCEVKGFIRPETGQPDEFCRTEPNDDEWFSPMNKYGSERFNSVLRVVFICRSRRSSWREACQLLRERKPLGFWEQEVSRGWMLSVNGRCLIATWAMPGEGRRKKNWSHLLPTGNSLK